MPMPAMGFLQVPRFPPTAKRHKDWVKLSTGMNVSVNGCFSQRQHYKRLQNCPECTLPAFHYRQLAWTPASPRP